MSVYAFCDSCKIQTNCPAEGNPYQPMQDSEDKTRINPKGCPNNDKFLKIRRMDGRYTGNDYSGVMQA